MCKAIWPKPPVQYEITLTSVGAIETYLSYLDSPNDFVNNPDYILRTRQKHPMTTIKPLLSHRHPASPTRFIMIS